MAAFERVRDVIAAPFILAGLALEGSDERCLPPTRAQVAGRVLLALSDVLRGEHIE